MKTNDAILSKIMKLFALSKSDNANEAAVALKKAKILMDAHNINLSEVSSSENVNEVRSRFKTKSVKSYEAALISNIAHLFNCEWLLYTDSRTSILFIGEASNASVASYVFEVMNKKLLSARKNYTETSLKRFKKVNKTKHADMYCQGWVSGVIKPILRLAYSYEVSEAVTKYMDKAFNGTITPGKSRKQQSVNCTNSHHNNRGYIDGGKESILTPISSASKKTQLAQTNYVAL